MNTTRSVIGRCLWSTRVYTMNWILRALWLVVAYDLSKYRHTADVIKKVVFFVLSNMAHSFENVCDIIPDWASEGLKKV